MGIPIGFNDSNGSDIGMSLVEKSYLINRYPELADTYRFSGLWGWGYNASGELGDNTIVSKSSPVQTIAGGTNWKQVARGYYSGGIKTDGTLWMWGPNQYGALGDNTIVNKSSPVQVSGGGTNWKQLSIAGYHAAAIKTDGTLWSWGWNFYGQLGINIVSAAGKGNSVPVQILGGGTNWKQVSAGPGLGHTAAIKTGGTLWLWGLNSYGALGLNDTTNRSSPTQVTGGGTNWKTVNAGYARTAAIKTDGTLWLWGLNSFGQLGINSTANTSTPVQVTGGGTNWKQVSCGYHHTIAIKTDGTLWTWGGNNYGQLATNDIVGRSTPGQTVAGGTNWKMVSIQSAIKTDGTLWTWGQNGAGQLGDNTIVNKSSPVQTIAGGTNWIFLGLAASMAIRDDSMDLL